MRATCFLFALALLAAAPAAAQYAATEQPVVAGDTLTLTLPAAVDTLTVTYRPGSNIKRVEHVAVSGGRHVWAPREGGLIALSTPGGPSQTVSVRFRRAPIGGLIILILAGGILFGGAAFASIKLFGKQPDTSLTDRPDT